MKVRCKKSYYMELTREDYDEMDRDEYNHFINIPIILMGEEYECYDRGDNYEIRLFNSDGSWYKTLTKYIFHQHFIDEKQEIRKKKIEKIENNLK